ncbi:hypothetical protein [Mesorhizobium sp. WSM4982]|uniref:hypothetical protein n=1 Tax=Mesorhizobium sp. WSM4982 TaxID=3038550 RepID=UPI0024158483|nr:hypothetical protein [Mesorhizobium sp. WSM4982]MDG4856437.1 hypothetical protein [Mesorhizobium sp. WSM4982]
MSVLKFAVKERRTGRYWSERGISVSLEDPDIKLYSAKRAATAAARIVGMQNARTNATHSTDLPEAYDVVTIRQTLEVIPT